MHADTVPQVFIYTADSTSGRMSLEGSGGLIDARSDTLKPVIC